MDVERIARPSRRAFEQEYLAAGRPVVIQGGMDGWAAMESWNEPYFRFMVGGREVPIASSPSGKFEFDPEAGPRFHVEIAPLGELFNRMSAPEERGRRVCFVQCVNIPARLPELENDYT